MDYVVNWGKEWIFNTRLTPEKFRFRILDDLISCQILLNWRISIWARSFPSCFLGAWLSVRQQEVLFQILDESVISFHSSTFTKQNHLSLGQAFVVGLGLRLSFTVQVLPRSNPIRARYFLSFVKYANLKKLLLGIAFFSMSWYNYERSSPLVS